MSKNEYFTEPNLIPAQPISDIKPPSGPQIVSPVQGPPEKKKPKMMMILIHAVAVVLILVGAIYFFYSSNQAAQQAKADAAAISFLMDKTAALETTPIIDGSDQTEGGTVPPADDTPAVSTLAVIPTKTSDTIKSAIRSQNTAALEGYMASSVKVIFADTSEETRTPADAISDINSLSNPEGLAENYWSFSPTLFNHTDTDFDQYFLENSIIGKNVDGNLIIFNFNSVGKINSVLIDLNGVVI